MNEFVSTRVLIDYDEFTNSLPEPAVICTNMGVLGAIRVLLRSYGLREVNWVTGYSQAGYTSVTEEQFDIIDNAISIFLGETNEMTFCTELTDAMNNLAVAFQAGCCGEGSFGAGQDEPPASTQPDEEGDYPPGFDTYAEYRTYKCDVANRIIEGIKEDMEWLAAGTLVTLTATGLVAALLTPIPFDEVLLLVGFVVSLLLQGVLTGTATAVADEIDTERESLVCLLYDAENATAAKASVKTYMAGLLTDTENGLFASVWTFAAVNALFGLNLLLETSPLPDAVSCTLCTSECESCVTTSGDEDLNGIFTIITPLVTDMVSGVMQSGGVYWGGCDFNTKEGPARDFCGPSVVVSSYALSGFTPWATQAYRIYNSSFTLIYNSSTPPIWSNYSDVRVVQLKSTTAFSGTVTIL